jgi:hypothetical protein
MYASAGKTKALASIEKKTRGIDSVFEATTFTTQLAHLTHVKKLVTKDLSEDDEDTKLEPITIVSTSVNTLSCVYYGRGHVMTEHDMIF